MKLILTVLFLLLTSRTYGNDICADLSHSYPLGAGIVHFKQIDCNTVERETYLNEQAMGDKSLLTISENWNLIKIDDEYELLTNQQRWMWNKDRTKIIHEFVVDSITKSDLSRDFMSGSEIYELSDKGVKKTSVKLRRKEDPSGKIDLKINNNSELLNTLKP